MDKTQYLNELRKYLKRVPAEELDEAMEYYTEYFEEAGHENEQKIIEELGAPKDLAKKIIIECVDKKFDEEVTSSEAVNKEKKDISPWLIVLAIFALPMSPVAIALVIVALAVILSLVLTIISFVVSAVAVALVGLFMFIVGIPAMFTSFSSGLAMIGLGLAVASVGAILFGLFITLIDLIIKGLVKLGGKFVHKKAGVKA